MNNGPARLNKKTDNVSPVNHIFDKMEAWAYAHAPLLLALFIVLLLLVFVIVLTALVGVSATDSGAMRNFVNGGYV
jgi:hypothetical protein